MDIVGRIIDYEDGELGEEETIELFQELVTSGLAWSLRGHYGRTAAALIDAGFVVPPRDHFGRTAAALIDAGFVVPPRDDDR